MSDATDASVVFPEGEEPEEVGPEVEDPVALSSPDQPIPEEALEGAAQSIAESLITLGFVSFDGHGGDNTSSQLLVSSEHRAAFRRDAYVGIRDDEQQMEFLGRVVEGPFYAPYEISADSAVGRTTVLHPDRTRFRPTYFASGTIEILGEVVSDHHILATATRPRPYSRSYLFPADRLEQMLGLAGDMDLGHLLNYPEVRVRAPSNSKSYLPRNVGIFGTVGSGKSNTTQVLIEEAAAAGWAVVVVDVEGEYVRMDEPTTDLTLAEVLRTRFGREPAGVEDVVVNVPSSGTTDAPNPRRFKVPIADVEPTVLGDLVELSEAQTRFLFPVLDQLRRQAPARAGAAQGAGRRMGALAGAAPSTGPSVPFTFQHLIDALDESQNYAGGITPRNGTEAGTVHVLRNKLIGLGRSGVLDWSQTGATPYLDVDDLMCPGRLSILDISETDDHSRNICISYVLQSLFNRVIDIDRDEPVPGKSFVRPPVLVVLEEVHTFVSRMNAGKMRAVLDQLQIISRRGRKRWMGLVLVSQQPGHVPDELFELANTRFIHQLKSSSNLAPVRQTTGGVHEALWSTVPSLGPGQCLLTGAVFRNPVFTNIRPASSRRMLID